MSPLALDALRAEELARAERVADAERKLSAAVQERLELEARGSASTGRALLRERKLSAALRDALANAGRLTELVKSLTPDEVLGSLEPRVPLVLLPVRIETRYRAPRPARGIRRPRGTAARRELWVRVYPEPIHVDAHEPELTAEELAAGEAFWAAAAGGESAARDAWATLAGGGTGEHRAAWIRLATAPGALPPALKRAPWTRAARAAALPDRFLFLALRRGKRIALVAGDPVRRPLAVSPDPAVQAGRGPAGLDEGTRWLVEFAEAERAGMGARVPLPAGDGRVDRLLVVGVAASLTPVQAAAELDRLLAAHRFTDGLGLLGAGTPTNVASTAQAPAASDRFARESGTPPSAVPAGASPEAVARAAATDAARLAAALGAGADHLGRTAGAGGVSEPDARAMLSVLWPGTIGSYLRDMLGGSVTDEEAAALRGHALAWVRPRGPLATLRVGAQPYGILPATSLARYAPDGDAPPEAARLIELLRRLDGIWAAAARTMPRAGAGRDPEAAMAELLAQSPVSLDYDIRKVHYRGTLLELAALAGVQQSERDGLMALHEGLVTARTRALGMLKDGDGLLLTVGANLRHRLKLPRVQEAELSDAELLREDYLTFLRTAAPADVIAAERRFGSPLLYLLARVGVLEQYVRAVEPSRQPMTREEWLDRFVVIDGLPGMSPRPSPLDLLTTIRGGGVPTGPPLIDVVRDEAGQLLRSLGGVLGGSGFGLPRTGAGGVVQPQPGGDGGTVVIDQPPGGRLGGVIVEQPPGGGIVGGVVVEPPGRFGGGVIVEQPPGGRFPVGEAGGLAPGAFGVVRSGPTGGLQPLRLAHEPADAGPAPGRGATLRRGTASARFASTATPVSRTGTGVTATTASARAAAVAEVLAGLEHLARRPTAVLDRLLRETLDLAAHRLDAWITSLATERLDALRATGTPGLHLGAYGWVEDLAPGPAPTPVPRGEHPAVARPLDRRTDSAGFVHAPSLQHAATAGVLRSAHLAHGGGPELAIDLSSQRVRTALWLLEGVRAGQPLGALLGYRLERALHERRLDRLIAGLRDAAPLARTRLASTTEPAEAIAPHDVVDGLRLLERLEAGELTPASLAPAADRTALTEELATLADAADAVADLLVAESVHQVVGGNPARASAAAAAAAGGHAPAELDVVRTPRSGTGVVHRVALLHGDDAPSQAWPAVDGQLRAVLDPAAEELAARWLGSPQRVAVGVRWRSPLTGDVLAPDPDRPQDATLVTLDELDLSALDVVLTAAPHQPDAQGELERRIADLAQRPAPGGLRPSGVDADAVVELVLDVDQGAGGLDLPGLLEIASAARRTLGRARPLEPADLAAPGTGEPAGIALGDLDARIAAALGVARGAQERLTKALDGDDATLPLDPVRAALRAVSALGIPGSWPASAVDPPAVAVAAAAGDPAAALPVAPDGAGLAQAPDPLAPPLEEPVRAGLLAQARSVLAELDTRLARADAALAALPATAGPLGGAADAQARRAAIRELVGEEQPLLAMLSGTAADEAQKAFARTLDLGSQGATRAGRASLVRSYVTAAAAVRNDLAALDETLLLGAAVDAPEPAALVAQLGGTAGERWVGLAEAPGVPLGGRTSLVALAPAGDPARATTLTGLLVDEWTEVVPRATEVTALAVHANRPNAEAPQAILLAVPPDPRRAWDLDTLSAVLEETLDRAARRVVDLPALGELGQHLPALYLNSTDIRRLISVNFDLLVRGLRR